MKLLTKKIFITALAIILAISFSVALICFMPKDDVYAAGSSNVITEGTISDVSHKTVTAFGPFMNTPMPENKLTYVTNVDADGDGTVDFDTAIKISGWQMSGANWIYFGLEFAKPVSIDEISSLNIRIYAKFTNAVELVVRGNCGYAMDDNVTLPTGDTRPTANYSKTVNNAPLAGATLSNIKNGLSTIPILENKLVYLADENGMVSDIAFSVGSYGGFTENDYLLIDKIYFDWILTLDNDYSSTGIETSSILVSGGKISQPKSQVFGYDVAWYSDQERQILFDFNNEITSNTTLYGKYTARTPELGSLAKFDGVDARFMSFNGELPFSTFLGKKDKDDNDLYAVKGELEQNDFEYVNDVDTDDDGVVDAANALKITGFDYQWRYFGLEFSSPVDISRLVSVNIRFYLHLADELYLLGAGKNITPDVANYSGSLWPWQAFMQDEWSEIEISGENLLKLADENGKFSSIAFAAGYGGGYYSDAYMYIDEITYNYNCKVTLDNDKDNTGLDNEEQVVVNGRLMLEPKSKLTGYDVVWYTNPERTIKFNFKAEKITKDITLYGKYEVSKLIVTFDFDEAATGKEPVEVAVIYNEKVAKPDVTIEGFSIDGYFIDEEYKTAFDFENTAITDDMTVYAKCTSLNSETDSVDGEDGGTQITSGTNVIWFVLGGVIVVLAGAAGTVIFIKKKKLKK